MSKDMFIFSLELNGHHVHTSDAQNTSALKNKSNMSLLWKSNADI